MTLTEREDTESWKRKHQIAFCGELYLDRQWICPKTDYIMKECTFSGLVCTFCEMGPL